MASPYPVFLACLLLALPTIQGLEYWVTNNAEETRGGKLFEKIMGKDRAQSSMQAASYFIWHRVFYQEKESDRKKVESIDLIIEPELYHDHALYHEICVENQYSYEIHLDAHHVIERIVPANFELIDRSVNSIVMEDRVISEINLRLTLGVAYALQWTANGAIPEALRNGIAAFAVLETCHKPAGWVKPGEGNQWDDSPEVTSQFFFYISKRRFQFVAKLNEKMRTSYERYFQEVAGLTIDECWKKYKEDNRPA